MNSLILAMQCFHQERCNSEHEEKDRQSVMFEIGNTMMALASQGVPPPGGMEFITLKPESFPAPSTERQQ